MPKPGIAFQNDPEKVAKDLLRTDFLDDHGIRVLRFGNRDVLTRPYAVVEAIFEALRTPSP
jgi:very-short-patch-repair endonuclease